MRINGHVRTAIVICLLGLSVGISLASSIDTPESVGVYRIAQAFNLYRITHDGELPKNWGDVSSVCNLDVLNKNLAPRGTAPIQDRYVFLTDTVSFIYENAYFDKESGRVLVIRTVPLADNKTGKQYRYFIYQKVDGEIMFGGLAEDRIQLMLKQANVTITPKPGLPAVESDEFLPGRDPNENPNPNDGKPVSAPSAIPPAPQPPAGSSGSSLRYWLVGVAVVVIGLLVWLRRRKE